MSETGNIQPALDESEHRSKNVEVKAVLAYGYDSTSDEYVAIKVDSNGDWA